MAADSQDVNFSDYLEAFVLNEDIPSDEQNLERFKKIKAFEEQYLQEITVILETLAQLSKELAEANDNVLASNVQTHLNKVIIHCEKMLSILDENIEVNDNDFNSMYTEEQRKALIRAHPGVPRGMQQILETRKKNIETCKGRCSGFREEWSRPGGQRYILKSWGSGSAMLFQEFEKGCMKAVEWAKDGIAKKEKRIAYRKGNKQQAA